MPDKSEQSGGWDSVCKSETFTLKVRGPVPAEDADVSDDLSVIIL